MPCSIAMVGAGPLGGLLPWGGVILTGPGWAYKGSELLQTLVADLKRFRIPIDSGIVKCVRRDGPFWLVEGEGLPTKRCLSVILASGFRVVGDEAAYFQKGVFITFKGYEYFPIIINEAIQYCRGRGLLVIGNRHTAALKHLLAGVSERAGGLSFLLDIPEPLDELADFSGRIIRGKLLEVVKGQSELGVSEFAITTMDSEGNQKRLTCGAILLDYNAFERSPSVFSSLADSENALNYAERDERGFIMVDRWMSTSVPGLFAAGDVTGRYSSTIMALGDGVCAGFSAYRWAFRAKFGVEPRLFAYRASDEVIGPDPVDLPPISQDSRPLLLGDDSEFIALAKQHDSDFLKYREALAIFAGHETVAKIAERTGCDAQKLAAFIGKACAARLMTVHVVKAKSPPVACRGSVKGFDSKVEQANGLGTLRAN